MKEGTVVLPTKNSTPTRMSHLDENSKQNESQT